MGKTAFVFLKHLWTIVPAILAGAAEIFRWWWGVNQLPPHWLFWLLFVAGIVLAIYLTYRELKVKQKTTNAKYSQRAKAQEIHTKLINLETKLWSVRDNVPNDIDVLDNTEVKKVFSDIQSEANKLATLVNNSVFEEFIEALLLRYSRCLEHNANPYKKPDLNIFDRAHKEN